MKKPLDLRESLFAFLLFNFLCYDKKLFQTRLAQPGKK